MRSNVSFLAVILTAALVIPTALQAGELEVHDAVIATSVDNRVPRGVDTTFPAFADKLYAFTRVVGATEDTFITHTWYYGNFLVAEVSLPVRNSNWRTWSAKNISPEWTGQWRVEVVTEDGIVIDRLYFTVE